MGNDYPAEKPSIRLIHRFESNKRSFYDMLSRSKRDALWQVPTADLGSYKISLQKQSFVNVFHIKKTSALLLLLYSFS